MNQFPFTEQLLTAGALRALQSCLHLCSELQEPEVSAEHLLAALFLDESRASEILQNFQISQDILPEKFVVFENRELPKQHPDPPPSIPQSAEFQTVLLAAQGRAGLLGRHAEIGTEHFLWGLLNTEGEISQLLAQHGLTSKHIEEEIDIQSGFETEPLAVDLQLHIPETTEAEHLNTYRLLDAAANRAREGMRVVEDYVRFTLDDAFLSKELKELRHLFTSTCGKMNQQHLLSSRNTLGDVGTTISTSAESIRESPLAVLTANFKRIQEALRTLEEWSKVVERDAAQQFEQLRYRTYQLEKNVCNVFTNRERLQEASLYLLLTESLCHHGSGPAVREALEAGVKIVQIREKEMPTQDLIKHAQRVREWTREADALLIINDRPDIAVAVDADGVHLGQDDFPISEARRIVGANRLIGLSTHNIKQARQAVRVGADYLGVGPTFPTQTKSFDSYAGLDYVRQVAEEITLPWFPIGGINEQNLNQVLETGATRAAVSSIICGSETPFEQTQQLLKQFQKA